MNRRTSTAMRRMHMMSMVIIATIRMKRMGATEPITVMGVSGRINSIAEVFPLPGGRQLLPATC